MSSFAAIEKMKIEHSEWFPNIKMVAGLSLGEYTALAFSGAFTWEEGLKLVKVRAEAMQSASEMTPSAMASIVGLDDERLFEIIENVICQTSGQLKVFCLLFMFVLLFKSSKISFYFQ
jgi:[acyl-carrier-protein] S-malonyltransferase